MKIYTKTGDGGETGLFGGKRLSKAHIRIAAYGTVDELNSHMGLLRDVSRDQDRKAFLVTIQNTLFVLGSMLAVEPGNDKVKIPTVKAGDVKQLEEAIDKFDAALPEMRNFILPGGHQHVSFCHIARAVCRRAERHVVALYDIEPGEEMVVEYLNRLSDYLFMLSRKMAQELEADEIPWISRDK